MIVNPEWTEWLEHRAGLVRSEIVAVSRLQRGLEQADAREEMDSFGRKEVRGFVGVVRASRPGAPLADAEPALYHAYLRPYLQRMLDLLEDRSAAVLPMAADEILFVWPDTQEDNGVKADRLVGALLEDLRAAQAELGPDYRIRVGISFGGLFLDRIPVGEVSQWVVLGAPVEIARALAAERQTDGAPFSASFGVGMQEAERVSFGSLLMALCGPRFNPQPFEELVETAGTRAAAAVLLPR